MKNILKIITVILIFSGSAYAQMFWNQAGSFNGNVNNYAVIPNSSSLNLTGDFTLECWVYKTSSASAYLFYKNGYSMDIGSSGKLAVNCAGFQCLVSVSVIPLNKWTHVAASYDGTYRVYINGILDTSRVWPNNPPTSGSDSLLIGRRDNGSGFQGLLDEMRIWKRALTGAEIKRNMHTSLGASSGVYNGLVLALTFQDENSNGTIFNFTDWSGSGNSAVNHNVAARNLGNAPSNNLSLNESLELDGSPGYFAVPNHTSFDLNGPSTIEAWVYMNEFNSGQNQMIISKGSTDGYALYVSSTGTLAYRINSVSGASFFHMPEKKWVHVAMTNDAANLYKIYVNDSLNISFTRTAYLSTTDSLFIGRNSSGNYFNGYIDEVRVAKFVKTQAEINEYLYQSVDASNDLPGTDIVWNFDGLARDNGNQGVRGYFRGSAIFSNPASVANTPVSPMVRADTINFTKGFTMKTSNRRIPATGTSGNMTDDSLVISGANSMSDVNLFLGVNHTFLADLDIVLIAPNGDSVKICDEFSVISGTSNDNLITIFDDNADSLFTANRYCDISSRIKPQNAMNSVFSGDNPNGVWKLRIRDDASQDTGRVYAWGIQINNSAVVGIENISQEVPNSFKLSQNYPNPFNPTTNIEFNIARKGFTKLIVYDILGRETATLVNQTLSPGTYKVDFNGSNLASGVYFYKLEAEGFTDIKKMIMVK